MGPKTHIRFTRLDAWLLLLLGAAAAWGVFAAISGEDGYAWRWSVIGRSLVKSTPDGMAPNLLLEGLFTTIRLSVGAMLLAFVLGTAVGLARTSKRLFWRLTAGTYVEFVRNTPPLVLIFLFYFFIGDQLLAAVGVMDWAYSLPEAAQEWLTVFLAPPGRLTQFLSALVTLALYEAAYIAEIVRSGVQSVEEGQWEAAYALGLSPWQRMRHVILPQAFRRMLPPLAGQFISTIKDSAIVSVISIPELTFQAMEIMASTGRTYEAWLTVLGMYLLLCLGCSLAARRLETRLEARLNPA